MWHAHEQGTHDGMAENDVQSIDFTSLPSLGSISGTVRPEIAGVTVTLRRVNCYGPIIATTTTDSDGHYAFTDLAPDYYNVTPDYPDTRFTPPFRAVRIK
jgi:protocatechuate 3,4-dioxygenase beta subunit